MNTILKFSIVAAALGVSACTDAGRFGNNDADSVTQGANGAFANDIASDPTSVAYFQQTVGDRVLFAVDQTTLTQDGQFTLQGQATWLKSNPDYTAVIEGHADEQGTTEYNLALGARRADAARAYLVSQGVSASRLKVVSYGKERPLEICSQESCYAKNRRAVTVLATGLTS